MSAVDGGGGVDVGLGVGLGRCSVGSNMVDGR